MKVCEPVPCPLCRNMISWWPCTIFRTEPLFMKCPSCAGELAVEFLSKNWLTDLVVETASILLLGLAFAAPVKWWYAGQISWLVGLVLIAILVPTVAFLFALPCTPILHPKEPDRALPFLARQYLSYYGAMGGMFAVVLLYWNFSAWESVQAPRGFDLIFLPAAIGYWVLVFVALAEAFQAAWTTLRTFFLIRSHSSERWLTLLRLLPLFALLLTWFGINLIEHRALQTLPDRARPLVQAIERHIAEKGIPPAQLTDLVPVFLAELPTPGYRIAPEFDYSRYTHPIAEEEIRWYGLGPGVPPATDTVPFPRSNPAEAALIFGINPEGKIHSVYTDGIPIGIRDIPFSPASWVADPSLRQAMATALEHQRLFGEELKSFEEKIGPPRREGLSRRYTWSLRVHVTHSWYVQHIHPPETSFATFGWGPILQAIYGDWAYIHHQSMW